MYIMLFTLYMHSLRDPPEMAITMRHFDLVAELTVTSRGSSNHSQSILSCLILWAAVC